MININIDINIKININMIELIYILDQKEIRNIFINVIFLFSEWKLKLLWKFNL